MSDSAAAPPSTERIIFENRRPIGLEPPEFRRLLRSTDDGSVVDMRSVRSDARSTEFGEDVLSLIVRLRRMLMSDQGLVDLTLRFGRQ